MYYHPTSHALNRRAQFALMQHVFRNIRPFVSDSNLLFHIGENLARSCDDERNKASPTEGLGWTAGNGAAWTCSNSDDGKCKDEADFG